MTELVYDKGAEREKKWENIEQPWIMMVFVCAQAAQYDM